MPVLRMLLLLLALMPGLALASIDHSPRVSDEELDRMRGGFIVNLNGMEFLMAFSLERLTYINGELVASTRLNPFALTPLAQFGLAVATAPTEGSIVIEAPSALQAASASVATPAEPAQASSETAAHAIQEAAASSAGTDTAAPSSAVTASSGSMAGASAEQTASSAEPGQAGQAPHPPASVAASGASSVKANAAPPSPAVASTGPTVSTQGGLTVIQNGPNNTIALPTNLSASALTTVIQNTLNDQVIRNITVLNATIQAQALAAQARLNAILNQRLNGVP